MNRTIERQKPFYKINETGEKEPTLISSFSKLKTGSTNYIERPTFKGDVINKHIKEEDKKPLSLNTRNGIGNYTMVRESFLQQQPAGRMAINFEQIERMKIRDEGIKISLGDKTLKDLFQVTTVDPSDKKWLEEYDRRIAAKETKEQIKLNPPFGRPQRPLQKMVNVADMTENNNLNKDEVINLLKQVAASNTNLSQIPTILAEVMNLVDTVEKIDKLTNENLKLINESLVMLGIVPKDAQEFFKNDYHKYWSVDQVNASLNRIMIYLYATNKKYTNDPLKPVFSFTNTPISWRSVNSKLSIKFQKTAPDRTIINQYDENKNVIEHREYYLDIDAIKLVTREEVVIAVNTGIDQGTINGQTTPQQPDGSYRWLQKNEIV